MFRKYVGKLIFRGTIFAGILYCYFFNKPLISEFVTFKLFGPITPFHFLWAVLMLDMIQHLLPRSKITMAGRKMRPENYVEQPHSEIGLHRFLTRVNVSAWTMLLVWVTGNAVFGILYLFEIIGVEELILLTMFYNTCDMICMLLFCPFQTYILKNRCCVNCRCYDWGHFMMYTPMVFIKSFFSWSLLFMSIIVMIRWELTYAKYPERFWYGSNKVLNCAHCKDKICRIKKPPQAALDIEKQETAY